jgi:hypothetical protein
MLIVDHLQRAERHEKNRALILDFLVLHRYSNLKNVAQELGHKSTATASRLLKKLCYEQLVKKETIKDGFTNVVLFGITQKGIDASGRLIDEHQPFHKSKVSLRTLEHTLINQYVGIKFKRIEGFNNIQIINTEFGNLKKYEHLAKFKHRPDLLVLGNSIKTNRSSLFVVETELSLKEKKRYIPIWREYLSLKKSGKINTVIYVVKNESAVNRLKAIMEKVKFNITGMNYSTSLIDDTFLFKVLTN